MRLTLSMPPGRRVITRNGDRRCQQRRRTFRTRDSKIDNEAGNVLAMWINPALRMHATERPRGVKQMLASLRMPASESGTIAPARAMERSWAFGLPSQAPICSKSRTKPFDRRYKPGRFVNRRLPSLRVRAVCFLPKDGNLCKTISLPCPRGVQRRWLTDNYPSGPDQPRLHQVRGADTSNFFICRQNQSQSTCELR